MPLPAFLPRPAHVSFRLLPVLLGLLAAEPALPQPAVPAPLTFAPTELAFGSGRKVTVDMARLAVPENRAREGSRTLELAVVKLASRAAAPAEPVFYLAGGPGGSAIGEGGAPHLREVLEALRARHDVYLMDQRGTGFSTPVLRFRPSAPLPGDFFESEEKAVAVVRAAGREAVEHFRAQGADLAGYTTWESAADLADLARAIGAERFHLIGFSYGTHFALATMRRYPQRVASAVLIGTEGPDHTYKLPSTYDGQIRRLGELVAADPKLAKQVPDFDALVRRVFARFDRRPMRFTLAGPGGAPPTVVTVGGFGLRLLTRIDIGDGNDFIEFPALFAALDRGDSTRLVKYVEKRFVQFGRGLSAMGTVMDLASGATAARRERILREVPGSAFGNVVNFPDWHIADVWHAPDLGDDYRAPLVTDVRTLFVSGTMDANTQPHQAEEVRKTFSRSSHLVLEHAGHEDMLPDGEVRRIIVGFFAGTDPGDRKRPRPRPRFVPVD